MEMISQLSLKEQQQVAYDRLDFTSDLFVIVSDNKGWFTFAKQVNDDGFQTRLLHHV